jgi:type I restriction enzyme S subunit
MKKGWQTKTLGELCEIELGKTPARANASFWDEERETSNVWLSIADLLKAEDNVVVDSKEYVSDKGAAICKLVPKGTLLVSFKLTLGRLAFAGRDLFTNEAIAALTIFNERELSKEFLFYCLTFFDWVKAAENDVKLKGMTLNKAKLKVMPVSFPPLAEQQRIVGLLDEAFEGLATAKANAEKNLQNARALFESHLQSVFTQRGPGWVETTLENVLTVQPQNGWSPPAAHHAASGTPVLTLSSVTGFVFRPDKLKYTSAKTDPKARYWIQNGDFLITRSNTPELVGHVAIASGIDKPTIYPDLIMRMNPMPDRALTEFLCYQLRTSVLRKEIMGRSQGANPTMKKISNGAVKTLPIAVPSIDTQQAIVETLDALTEETQRLARLYEQKLAALEALKKSLLHQAITGAL